MARGADAAGVTWDRRRDRRSGSGSGSGSGQGSGSGRRWDPAARRRPPNAERRTRRTPKSDPESRIADRRCDDSYVRPSPYRHRGRRAAGPGGGARVSGRASGRRGRRRVRQRVRGGQGGHRALARSAVPRRADAEVERLRGARAARPRRAGHLHDRLRSVRAARVRGARGRLPAQAVQRGAVCRGAVAGAGAAAREGPGRCRMHRSRR